MPPTARKWAYSIMIASGAVAIQHGVATTGQVDAWVSLGAALIASNGLALWNAPRGKHRSDTNA